MAIWPTNLPDPLTSGYSIQPQQAFIRTDMDQGPARQRRRFTTTPTVYLVKWIMSEQQFGIFESWFRDEADDGAAWFTINLRGGTGIQAVEARFMQPWTSTRVAPMYEVDGQLEVRNRPIDTRSF